MILMPSFKKKEERNNNNKKWQRKLHIKIGKA